MAYFPYSSHPKVFEIVFRVFVFCCFFLVVSLSLSLSFFLLIPKPNQLSKNPITRIFVQGYLNARSNLTVPRFGHAVKIGQVVCHFSWAYFHHYRHFAPKYFLKNAHFTPCSIDPISLDSKN